MRRDAIGAWALHADASHSGGDSRTVRRVSWEASTESQPHSGCAPPVFTSWPTRNGAAENGGSDRVFRSHPPQFTARRSLTLTQGGFMPSLSLKVSDHKLNAVLAYLAAQWTGDESVVTHVYPMRKVAQATGLVGK